MNEMQVGKTIAALRKEKGMTQKDLAQLLHVTDKAVSKWERNASCPDIGTIPKLAEVLGLDVNELMGSTAPAKPQGEDIVALVLKAVPLAMGVAVSVLSFIGQITPEDAIGLLGIGMTCLAISNFRK